MSFQDLLQIAPYSLSKNEKEKILTERLVELTRLHRQNCPEYREMLRVRAYEKQGGCSYKDLPFLPVRLFKELSLQSVPQSEIVKIMTSSGTSGQKVSRIFLDRTTSANQQKAMVKIVNDFTGATRMPMVIIDCPSVVKDRKMFSARGAGILGFSIFGSRKIYALNDDMQLDIEGLETFLSQYKEQKILLFGFTFMVWQYFYKELARLKREGKRFDLSGAVLIHGGGWKKLASEAVSPEEFRAALKDVAGIEKIHNYYGMVEQTGCIYMECEYGHLHASVFSDVIARRPENFSECEIGEQGILQVVSTLPESYPGHSLLTEDMGVILGEDDCHCGRKGTYFKVYGRLKNAELRGCSDTFAAGLKETGRHKDNQEGLNKMSFLLGNKAALSELSNVAPMGSFAENVLDFLQDISRELMQSHEARVYPDIMTLAFWLRKSSILLLKERFTVCERKQIGRGVAFHIAPSNVPVNYAYSLFTGIICGNANVVRVPSKDFPQTHIINCVICRVLEKHPELKPYIILLRYERSKTVNDFLSSLCDVRVIWGGDSTIAEVRKSPLPPRAAEITFADRYSLAIIDSDEYIRSIKVDNKAASRLASDFYNDTYLSDQNACTSPQVVVWLGQARKEAKEMFWGNLLNLVKQKYPFQPVQGIDKLSMEYLASAAGLSEMKQISRGDNRLVRVQITELSSRLMDYRGNSGYFYEFDCDDILALRNFCGDTRCQTIGLLGDTSLVEPLLRTGIRGVDRIVPIGHTMDFDLVWDGYNLVERLTRTIQM